MIKDAIKLLKTLESAYTHMDNKWKAAAYGKAARALSSASITLTKDTPVAALTEIPSIGKSIAQTVKDFMNGVRSDKILEIETQLGVPLNLLEQLLELTKIPKIGAKTARKLYQEHGILTLEDLKQALITGKLKGALEESVRDGLRFVESQSGRMPYHTASIVAGAVYTYLKPFCTKIQLAGSLRRKEPSIKDFDFVVVASPDEIKMALNNVTLADGITVRVLQGHEKKIMCELDINIPGYQELRHMDVTFTTSESFGNNVNYLTGSRDFNISLRALALQHGFTVNEHFTTRLSNGQQMSSAEETDLYNLLAIPFVPPECRLTGREINDSRYTEKSLIPVNVSGICGDFHTHSNSSDGLYSIEHVVNLAKSCGYSFIGISDHSVSSHGVLEKDLPVYVERVHRAGQDQGFPAFAGSEVDVDTKGKLDYTPESITLLDYVILSTHRENGKNVPERLMQAINEIRAISNIPIIIAHPTGRIIGRREGYQGDDWPAFFEFCINNNVILEINSLSDRKDLPGDLIRKAVKAGCKFVIGSDMHGAYSSLNETMENGIWEARRGGLSKTDVLNTSFKAVEELLKK